MNELNIGNIPALSPKAIIKRLSTMYINAINNNYSLKLLPSVMLWGQPGIGKSQSIGQLAKNIEENTNKTVNITDVRLILFNPIDLRGIPTANEDKTLAVWLKPKIFDMKESDDTINILFLDEISAAPQSVQAAAYQITLDRKIGEHNLPDNCIVIAAGNRVTDKSVAYQMPKALANRLLHLEMNSDFTSWLDWALTHNIHYYVIGFLRFMPHNLNTYNPQNNSLTFATPRSWEMISNILNYVSDSLNDVYDLIAGIIGKGVAVEFRSWVKLYSQIPNVEDIFAGKNVEVPVGTDIIYALTSSMLNYAKKYQNDLDKLEHSIEYAIKLPPDFSAVLLKDYMYINKDMRTKLLMIPAFKKWVAKQGKLLDIANGK